MNLKTVKEMLKKIYLALFLFAALACKASPRYTAPAPDPKDLKPDPRQSVVAKELVNLIENAHYKKIEVNDSLSSVIFDRYLKELDAGRAYFLQSDISDFEKYRRTLDDDLRKGDLSVPFYIYNTYLKRYNQRLNYALSQVNEKFDFTSDDTFIYDREKLPWITSEAQSNDLWKKRVKYELLNLKVAGSDPVKNTETIKKRYQNLLLQVAKTNNQDVFQTLMASFTEAVDPHTNYFVPTLAQDFNEELARNYEGIGARLQLENEVVQISEVIPGGPAFKAGTLHAKDRIIAVAQGKDGEFIDVTGWRLDETVTKIKGPKGTLVRLKVIPAEQELSSQPKIVPITRDKIVLEDQSAKKTVRTVTSAGKTYRIGVITVPAFYADYKAYNAGDMNYKSTTRDVKILLDSLKQQKVDGVVLDLRFNGGGSLVEAVSLTGLFIKTGPVVQVRDTENKVEIDADRDPAIAWEGPLAIMVDRTSASASEIFAGAIQDYGRGIIIGTQTYGKGTVQQGLDLSRFISPADKAMIALNSKVNSEDQSKNTGVVLPQFGQVNFTFAKFYRINGSSTQNKGVTPDISLPMIYSADKFGESSEPSALPWDTIAATRYNPVADLQSYKKTLADLHQKRMAASQDFKNLEEDIKQYSKLDKENSVSLNEAALRKERDEREAKTLARENQRRAARNLPMLKKGDPRPKDDYDFIRDESLQVMGDFIRLKENNRLTQTSPR